MTQIPAAPQSSLSPLPPLSTRVTGSGPGVLLAHGATGSIDDNYSGLIPLLAASGHTVVAPDYPGSGHTPRAAVPLTLDDLADALVDQADRAGLETFTVIGYSVGTGVSVRLAARYPERVRGLVLTAGLARPDHRIGIWLDLWLDHLARGDYAGFARLRALSGFSPEFLERSSQEELARILDPDPSLPPRGSAEQAALVKTVDTVEDLPGIAVPTLVIATTQDQLVHPSNSHFLAERIPGAAYAEIEAGHVPMVERPREWHALIEGFLAERGL